ncbi:MAG: protoheme IX farnesyltransferase [Bacteroidetes bacterium B1(2017)]|nr:MAG: protoheme IX farnesyltransferase [Bacteroidetes bacterium B1(2017)]
MHSEVVVSEVSYLRAKAADYNQLVKFRLTFLVVFSSVVTYLTAATGAINWFEVAMLSIGGFLVTGASNGINQIIEKDYDKLMLRTANRPLATNRMSVTEAGVVSLLMGISGVVLIGTFLNPLCGWLALGALMSYAFVYTPLKRISPISVFVGAFPGAIPTLLGWVAFTGKIDMPAIILFGVQFFWQFPHFWSIAWILDDDYKRAGFKMLPSTPGRDKGTAFQTLTFSLALIPIGMLPYQYGVSGMISAFVGAFGGLLLTYYAFKLFRSCETADAKKLMFASFIYLPMVQLAYLIDKI